MSEAERVNSMSFFSRLVNIFVAPSKVFQFLAGKPLWVVPLVVISLCVGFQQLVIFNSEVGKKSIQEDIQKNPMAAQLTPEQIDQQLSISAIIAPVAALVMTPIITFALEASSTFCSASCSVGRSPISKHSRHGCMWVSLGWSGYLSRQDWHS